MNCSKTQSRLIAGHFGFIAAVAAIAVGFAAASAWPAFARTIFAAQDARRAPDEVLWTAIQELESKPALLDDTSFDRRIEATINWKEALIEKLRSYQQLYPGGAHFAAAADDELEALFELGTLRNDYSRLESRLAEFDALPATLASAAWWRIHSNCLMTPVGIPSTTVLIDRDRLRGQAMAAFARRFPKSPLALRAATQAGEECIQRRDIETAREWVQWMEINAPGTPNAVKLAGLLRRVEATRMPMTGQLSLIDGGAVDLASLRGNRVTIAIWDARDAASRQWAAELQEQSAAQPDFRIVGVDLSDSLEQTRRIAAEIGLTWIHTNDRRGRGGEFVRKWGIDEVPSLILLDAAGSIMSIAGPTEVKDALRTWLSLDIPHLQPTSRAAISAEAIPSPETKRP